MYGKFVGGSFSATRKRVTSGSKESIRLGVQNHSEVDREVVFRFFDLLSIEETLDLLSEPPRDRWVVSTLKSRNDNETRQDC